MNLCLTFNRPIEAQDYHPIDGGNTRTLKCKPACGKLADTYQNR